MNYNTRRNSLSLRTLRYALCGMVFAFVFFAIAGTFFSKLLSDYLSGSTYYASAFETYRQDLQKYVEKNKVKATDAYAIHRWAKDKHFAHFVVVRETEDKQYLLYDDSYGAS